MKIVVSEVILVALLVFLVWQGKNTQPKEPVVLTQTECVAEKKPISKVNKEPIVSTPSPKSNYRVYVSDCFEISANDLSTPKPSVETEEPYAIITVTITAYCPCPSCCGIWSAQHESRIGTDYVQKTSSGTIPTAGRTIATDPSVIPAGSKVVIDGHTYIAEDTGGGIKGNRIDIYFDTHQEALNWGVQTKEIKVYEPD